LPSLAQSLGCFTPLLTRRMLREQNEIALIETESALRVVETTAEVPDSLSSEESAEYRKYREKGGWFSQEIINSVISQAEETLADDKKIYWLKLSPCWGQAKTHASYLGVEASDEQRLLYSLLRICEVDRRQMPIWESPRNPFFASDRAIFAEVLKLPSLAEWNAVQTASRLSKAA